MESGATLSLTMDIQDIFEVIDQSTFDMDNSTCDELMHEMDHLEYVIIEDGRTHLFEKRINYICMANSFYSAMERDYNCKQMKTFFKKHWEYDDARAQKTADKLNGARRVHPRLEIIVRNCCSVRQVDIRDLTIHEMYLAYNLSWVLKRNAEVKPKARVPDDVPVDVDAGSVEETKRHILNADWYLAACHTPNLVATILSGISTHVMNDSIYKSQKK